MMFQQTQQALMGGLQSQAQLPQQIGFTPTSADPVFSSRSCAPSTSQTTYSVAPLPTTVHTPVTTVQSYSEQHNSPSLSSSQVRSYSYIRWIYFLPLAVLYIYIYEYHTLWHH